MKRKITFFQNFQWDFTTSCFIRRQIIYNIFYKLFRNWLEGEFAGNFIVNFIAPYLNFPEQISATSEIHIIPEHISLSLFNFSLKRLVGTERKRLSHHRLIVIIFVCLFVCLFLWRLGTSIQIRHLFWIIE